MTSESNQEKDVANREAPAIRDRAIDDVVQHTDSGSGTSQREHWPANVDQPDNDNDDR